MVILGIILGVLVTPLYLPIFQIGSLVANHGSPSDTIGEI